MQQRHYPSPMNSMQAAFERALRRRIITADPVEPTTIALPTGTADIHEIVKVLLALDRARQEGDRT